MGHKPIQQKNGPLTTEIAILNLERMAHWNFTFIDNKWKMAHTMVCPAITLLTQKYHSYSAVIVSWDEIFAYLLCIGFANSICGTGYNWNTKFWVNLIMVNYDGSRLQSLLAWSRIIEI